MMEKRTYLIVGAGLTGCVLAERLSLIGQEITLIDKKDHIGGHCYDCLDEAGVLIHKYGPHYFRTNFLEVKEYLSKFTEWTPTDYIVKASIEGELFDFPINRNTINKFFNKKLQTAEEVQNFLDTIRKKEIKNPQNAEEQVLKLVGKELYEAFFKEYTKKQWDTDPKNLNASVTARIPIRYDNTESYFDSDFKAMPKEGYTKMFEKMILNNPKIKLVLNTDYKSIKNKNMFDVIIYTGPIDTFFNFKYGKLKYRSLNFQHKTYYDKEYYQEYSQINYPGSEKYTRAIEIKHVTKQKVPNTTVIYEYPTWENDPYYPVPSKEDKENYQKYFQETKKLDNVYFIGRLATYKYLNMDQIVKQSLDLFEEIKKRQKE